MFIQPKLLKEENTMEKYPMGFKAFGHGHVKSMSTVKLEFQLPTFSQSHWVTTEFHVVDESPHGMILRRNFQSHQKIVIDWMSLCFVWDGITSPMSKKHLQNTCLVLEEEMLSLVDVLYTPTPIWKLVPLGLQEDQRKQIYNLLLPYQTTLFSGKPGNAQVKPHVPLLKPDAIPCYNRYYKTLESQREVTKRELDRLLNLGIIHQAESSQWGSLCFTVPKKTGDLWLVVDYHWLNCQKIRRPFPLLRIQEILNRLDKKVYFSQLDLNMGYYVIPIAQEQQHLYTFITEWGTYTFQYLPFGDDKALNVFQ